MQVAVEAVLLLGAADEEQQFAHVSAYERSLLRHHVLTQVVEPVLEHQPLTVNMCTDWGMYSFQRQ